MRPLGEILLDLEVILDEMVDSHELQWGDIRSLVMGHLKTHRPDAQEEYEEGGNPFDYYGPEEALEHSDRSFILLFKVLEEWRIGRPRRQWRSLMEKVEEYFSERTN